MDFRTSCKNNKTDFLQAYDIRKIFILMSKISDNPVQRINFFVQVFYYAIGCLYVFFFLVFHRNLDVTKQTKKHIFKL